MQKARIDKYGRLILTRGEKETTARCCVMGLSTIRIGWKSFMPSTMYCSHTCPGWEEGFKNRDRFAGQDVDPSILIEKVNTVTLKCLPGEPVYEIVKDDRNQDDFNNML